VNTESDSEVLLNIFANCLQKTEKFRVNEEDIFEALKGVYSRCRGAYACVAMIAGYGLIAFRVGFFLQIFFKKKIVKVTLI
jgi:amidophosphoribosyltransferase